jgi:hypothetical protein
MAIKKTVASASRSNKIRFVLVEAEIGDGNLSELTNAISNALKPAVAPVRPAFRTVSPRLALPGMDENSDHEPESEVQHDNLGSEDSDAEEEPIASRSARPRSKPALPKYLPDLDLNGTNGKSFKDYALEIDPKKHIKRYLVAAAWMKEYGSHETVNSDIVYTAYKTASWPLGINDWDANFRGAVKRDLMHRKSPGEYTITPLGEAALQKAED